MGWEKDFLKNSYQVWPKLTAVEPELDEPDELPPDEELRILIEKALETLMQMGGGCFELIQVEIKLKEALV